MTVTYTSVNRILVLATCSLFEVLLHNATKGNGTIGSKVLNTRICGNLLIIPSTIVCNFLHCATYAHRIEVCSIKSSALCIHYSKHQLVELVITSHIREVGVWVCILVLSFMYALQSRNILRRIACATRLEHLFEESVRSGVRANGIVRDNTMRLLSFITLQLAVGCVERR